MGYSRKENEMDIIKKGKYFIASSGAYSDYSIVGLFFAQKDIAALALRDIYLEEYPTEKRDYAFSDGHFMKWLTDGGYCEEVGYMELHLSDYGVWDEMTVSTED
jgi:hypothetical protein